MARVTVESLVFTSARMCVSPALKISRSAIGTDECAGMSRVIGMIFNPWFHYFIDFFQKENIVLVVCNHFYNQLRITDYGFEKQVPELARLESQRREIRSGKFERLNRSVLHGQPYLDGLSLPRR